MVDLIILGYFVSLVSRICLCLLFSCVSCCKLCLRLMLSFFLLVWCSIE